MNKFLSTGRKAIGLLALALPALLLAQSASRTAPPTPRDLQVRMRAVEVELADIGAHLASSNSYSRTQAGDGLRLAIIRSATGDLQFSCVCSVTPPTTPNGPPPHPQVSGSDLDLGMQAIAVMRENDAAGRATVIVAVAAQRSGEAAPIVKAAPGKAAIGESVGGGAVR